jgi:hypothetical protein
MVFIRFIKIRRNILYFIKFIKIVEILKIIVLNFFVGAEVGAFKRMRHEMFQFCVIYRSQKISKSCLKKSMKKIYVVSGYYKEICNANRKEEIVAKVLQDFFPSSFYQTSRFSLRKNVLFNKALLRVKINTDILDTPCISLEIIDGQKNVRSSF